MNFSEETIRALKLLLGEEPASFGELSKKLSFISSVMVICHGAMSQCQDDVARLRLDIDPTDPKMKILDKLKENFDRILSVDSSSHI